MCVVAGVGGAGVGVGAGAGAGGGGSPAAAVERALELGLARRRRAHALRYGTLNAALLLLLAYDLSSSCATHRSALHYAELCAAALLCASLLHHAARLLPPARLSAPPPTICITRQQKRLLALHDADLDSSFRVVDSPEPRARRSASPVPLAPAPEELSLSLSPARSWRASTPPSPPGSPPGSPSLGSDHDHDRSLRDEFISDRESLGDYLKQYAARERQVSRRQEGGEWRSAPPRPALALAPPHYALASTPDDELSGEERVGRGEGEVGVGGGGGGLLGAPGGSVRVWWRLRLDPLRLTQFNLNLRLWLQMTILARLRAALEAAERALERLGLPAGLAQVSLARLQALAAGAAPGLAPLLPYLEPYPDLQYTVRRIRELSAGGCLSEYRWNGGGRGWGEAGGEARPSDAELVLHLFAAYMDRQLPAAPAPPGPRARPRPFSAHYLSASSGAGAGAGAAPAPARDLAVHRVTQRPPHYVLLLDGETLDVGRGRNNLLHTLLLFIAAAARASPPALHRLQLGPAGLNVLWVIGR